MNGPGPIEKAKIYHRIKLKLGLTEFGLWLLFLALLLFTEVGGVIQDLALSTGSSPLIWVLAYYVQTSILFEIINLPLTILSGYYLEKKFNLLNQSPGSWTRDLLLSWFISLLLGAGAVEIIYLCILKFGIWWWLPAGAFFSFFLVVLAQLAPVLILPLFFKFKKLPDSELTSKLQALCDRVGAGTTGIYEWGLSAKTQKANAAVIGLGASRRVALSDSLLEKFTPSEIEVVLAHELGHHLNKDMFILLTVQSAASFAIFYLGGVLYMLLGPFFFVNSLQDIAGLPVLALVFTFLILILLPILNAQSRRLERRADLFALQNTGLAGSFISAMERLAALNLSIMTPHPLEEFLLYSHPSPSARIAAAKDFLHKAKGRDQK